MSLARAQMKQKAGGAFSAQAPGFHSHTVHSACGMTAHFPVVPVLWVTLGRRNSEDGESGYRVFLMDCTCRQSHEGASLDQVPTDKEAGLEASGKVWTS